MHRLIAIFEIRLPFYFLIKRAEEDKLRYKIRIDDFDVELFLKRLGGAKQIKGDEEHWSSSISDIQVKVAKEEHIEPPPIRMLENGGRDLSASVPYFAERFPKYREVALVAVNRLIRFFKFRLHNPLLYELGPHESDFQNPKWTNEADQKIDPGIMHFIARAAPGLGSSEFGVRHLTSAVDLDLQKALEIDAKPDLTEELLSDAHTAIFQKNFRRAVLEMAMSCEIAIKQTFFSKPTPAGIAFEYLEDRGRINITVLELIDAVAKQVFGESFKDLNKAAYESIDYLFRCRNKVAHRAEVVYRDDRNVLHKIDLPTLNQWWESIGMMFEWLNAHK